MDTERIEEAFRTTLEDRRFSRSDRRALIALLESSDLGREDWPLLRHRAFRVALDAITDPRARQVVEWLEDLVRVLVPAAEPGPGHRSDACFSPGPDCRSRVIALIHPQRPEPTGRLRLHDHRRPDHPRDPRRPPAGARVSRGVRSVVGGARSLSPAAHPAGGFVSCYSVGLCSAARRVSGREGPDSRKYEFAKNRK